MLSAISSIPFFKRQKATASGDATVEKEVTVYTIKGKNDYIGGVTVTVDDGKIISIETTNAEVSTADGTNTNESTTKLTVDNTTLSVKDNALTVKCDGKTEL
jgi:hypothetical protein